MANLIDHLVYQAHFDPKAIALQDLERQLTFGQLFFLVKKIASKLRQAGIKPGNTVVTSFLDNYLDWIITLALFHEATITCGNHGYAPIDGSIDYDWIITDSAKDYFDPDKTILVDNDWIADAQNQSYEIDQFNYESSDSVPRLILTSGTTGQNKVVPWNIGVCNVQVITTLRNFGCTASTLSLFGNSTGIGFKIAYASLVMGYTYYCTVNPDHAIKMMNRFSIESIVASPQQISAVINNLESSGKSVSSLKSVWYAGGPLTPRMLGLIERHLSTNIVNCYGATEVGLVSCFKPNRNVSLLAVGYALVAGDYLIQIVDASHEPLPVGEEGLVRIKTPEMAHEYYNDPEATAESYRDGWFYSGDRGRLLKNGLLVLAGRDSELINLGGPKIDPVLIDQVLIDYPGIQDAAVFGLENKMGRQQVAAAIVVSDNFDLESLRKELLSKLGQESTPTIFFRLDRIPRNQMGKAMRAQMSRHFEEVMAKNEAEKDAQAT